MTQTIQIIMELGGERYTPELAEDRGQFGLVEVAKDIYCGEFPGQFVAAAIINWTDGTMENVTAQVWEMIGAHQRRDAA